MQEIRQVVDCQRLIRGDEERPTRSMIQNNSVPTRARFDVSLVHPRGFEPLTFGSVGHRFRGCAEICRRAKSFPMKEFRKEAKAVRLAATSTVYSSYHRVPGILYHILYHGPVSTPSSFLSPATRSSLSGPHLDWFKREVRHIGPRSQKDASRYAAEVGRRSELPARAPTLRSISLMDSANRRFLRRACIAADCRISFRQ